MAKSTFKVAQGFAQEALVNNHLEPEHDGAVRAALAAHFRQLRALGRRPGLSPHPDWARWERVEALLPEANRVIARAGRFLADEH